MEETKVLETLRDDYAERYGFRDEATYLYETPRGLSRRVVEEISAIKNEPEWMRQFRLRAYEIFLKKPMPTWGADLSGVDFDRIVYYARPTDRPARSWDEVPEYIKRTFERLGIPEAERKFLAGVEAQYDSESVYSNVREDLARMGVIFCSTDEAVQKYPDLVREYIGTVVSIADNKFAALNSAVWSGGTFIYVPPGVRVEYPLQAYFRINREAMGQFERTLIIADEGAFVHYVEGCTAPIYTEDSLHAAVVEIIVKRGARVRYTTIQNWSNNVYNLVTKRAFAYEEATMEWVDCNIGSKVTMKYPAVYLLGRGAHGEVLYGLCRRWAASGYRSQDDPSGSVYDLAGAVEVHLQRHRTGQLSRVAQGLPGCRACQSQCFLRCASAARRIQDGHLPHDGDSGAERPHRP